MRVLVLLAAVVGVALAQEAVVPHPAVGEDGMAQVEVEVDDDGRFDAARLLQGLFNNEEDETALAEMDDEGEVEGRSKDEEESGPEDLSRYNNFVDTMFRRMNSQARTRNDPMSISLSAKKSKGGSKGKKSDKGGKSDKKAKGKKKGKKGDKKGEKKAEKGEKKKKGEKTRTSRHPKDLSVDEALAEELEQGEHVEEPEQVEERQKREVEEEHEEEENVEEGELAREQRSMDHEEEGEEVVETSRKNRPAGTKAKKAAKKDKKKKGSKKKGNKKSGKKTKKTKGSKKRTRKSLPRVRTSRANVIGIATLRRVGDVKVINRKDAKEIRSQFALGPVGLSVDRKFGYGKDTVTRTARATSPELKGKMSILVSADGKARVAKFFIAKPSIVRVEGTLHKEVKSGSDNNFMENSLNRITPFATKRLKAAAREILATTASRTS